MFHVKHSRHIIQSFRYFRSTDQHLCLPGMQIIQNPCTMGAVKLGGKIVQQDHWPSTFIMHSNISGLCHQTAQRREFGLTTGKGFTIRER